MRLVQKMELYQLQHQRQLQRPSQQEPCYLKKYVQTVKTLCFQ